jgi:hypothetical protein
VAKVRLRGHAVDTRGSPRRSLRRVNHWEMPANTVATIPRRIRAVPIRIASRCSRRVSALGDFSSIARKKATIPNPKLAIVKVVLIQARVVRSSASAV